MPVSPSAPWIPLGAGVAAILGIYAPVVPAMVAEWAAFPNLSHGFAIPFIAAYLIWARRERIAREALGSSPLGLPLVVLGLAALALGSLGGEPFLARVSLPVMLLGTVLFLAGARVARHVWSGIGFLLFMIPLPYLMRRRLFGGPTGARARSSGSRSRSSRARTIRSGGAPSTASSRRRTPAGSTASPFQ